MPDHAQPDAKALPFDATRLDALLEEAGIDVLLVNTKHNLHYLLGGYRFFFFEHADAAGLTRYLPILVYVKGAPEKAAYFGHPLESYEKENRAFWVPQFNTNVRGADEAIAAAIAYIRSLGRSAPHLGIEAPFLPSNAGDKLRAAFGESGLRDAVGPLERLRARKTASELALVREATERVGEAMLAVIGAHGPGTTKRALVEALRRAETERGLEFEYCLITAGTSQNRAPSDQRWESGDILSLDSGGTYGGYIGDICRMGILGTPDAELEDLLAQVDSIQRAAMQPVRPGVLAAEVYAGAERALAASREREQIRFVAHGVGLITHEVPHLTTKGPVPYADDDLARPLEAGMVLSIETTLHHARRGFIKLEDTVAVTAEGYELYGDRGRGWNRGRV